MKPEEVKEALRGQVDIAAFSAGFVRRGEKNRPEVHVYPLKNGNGYLWIIRDGKFDWNDVNATIRTGGIFAGDLEGATMDAISVLFAYKEGFWRD